MIDINILENIISGAWLQAEDNTKIMPDASFHRRFLHLMTNELIKRGITECKNPHCHENHAEAIDKKYLFT